MKGFKPNIVIFRCNWCAPAGAEYALTTQLKDNPNPRIIQTTCTGRIDPTFVYDAFTKGADGVMVVGCAPGDCHYVTGNYKASRNMLLLKRVLSQFGIESERLHTEWLLTTETAKFFSALNEFVNRLTKLGPLTLN